LHNLKKYFFSKVAPFIKAVQYLPSFFLILFSAQTLPSLQISFIILDLFPLGIFLISSYEISLFSSRFDFFKSEKQINKKQTKKMVESRVVRVLDSFCVKS
jgi:hypothetical protein